MADPRKTFGDLLRATRVAKGYSLRKFAEMSDMSPTYLSQVEQGKVERPPLIFATNYWLKGADGQWLNGKLDKHVWLKWMERRVHGQTDAIDGPTGLLPQYEDLKALFAEVLDTDYTEAEYVEQFSIRVRKNLEKLDRLDAYFGAMADLASLIAETLAAQRRRLEALQAAQGDLVSPLDL